MQGVLPGTLAEKVARVASSVFESYVDNVVAYLDKKTRKFGMVSTPDEPFMRQIEEAADIPEIGADDFRRSIAAFCGHIALKGSDPRWDSNPTLRHAILSYIAEHQPECLEVPTEKPKYRRIDDPWEQAW